MDLSKSELNESNQNTNFANEPFDKVMNNPLLFGKIFADFSCREVRLMRPVTRSMNRSCLSFMNSVFNAALSVCEKEAHKALELIPNDDEWRSNSVVETYEEWCDVFIILHIIKESLLPHVDPNHMTFFPVKILELCCIKIAILLKHENARATKDNLFEYNQLAIIAGTAMHHFHDHILPRDPMNDSMTS